jgi:histidinol-phosphatase (PHP family)
LNAAGIHTAAKEMYPSTRMLRQAHALQIPLTYGSDAHHPDRVGQKGDEARALLKEVGFCQISTFNSRKRDMIPL